MKFWKGAAATVVLYSGAIGSAFLVDFRLALFLVLALQLTWTLFCVSGVIRGWKDGDRDGYRFALGGAVSSLTLLFAIVVLTQAV